MNESKVFGNVKEKNKNVKTWASNLRITEKRRKWSCNCKYQGEETEFNNIDFLDATDLQRGEVWRLVILIWKRQTETGRNLRKISALFLCEVSARQSDIQLSLIKEDIEKANIRQESILQTTQTRKEEEKEKGRERVWHKAEQDDSTSTISCQIR